MKHGLHEMHGGEDMKLREQLDGFLGGKVPRPPSTSSKEHYKFNVEDFDVGNARKMTSKVEAYDNACAGLEAAVIYRDFIGQISGFYEVAKSCDLNDDASVTKSLEILRAYLPLIEAMEKAAIASRSVIGVLEEAGK